MDWGSGVSRGNVKDFWRILIVRSLKFRVHNHTSKLKAGGVMGVWLGYVWIKTMAGLAIHPYKSIKRMVWYKSERVLLPVVLSPTVLLVGLMVVGRIGSYMFELSGWQRELVAGVLGISLIGLLLWQGLVVGLVWRFWRARKDNL